MPRTVFGPARGYAKTPEDLRRSAERRHRRQEEWAFLFPLRIEVETQSAATGEHRLDTKWEWKHPYSMGIYYKKPRDELLPEDYRRFCFKDCALYATWHPLMLARHLFERIYPRWFPSRSEDVDISHRSFFCEWIAYDRELNTDEPSPTIADVFAFHKELCARAKQAIPNMGLPKPCRDDSIAPDAEHALLWPHAEYKLRSSFERCFLYIHAGSREHCLDSPVMKKHGVLVVFLQEVYAVEHGCANDADQEGIVRVREEEQGLDGGAVFRCDTIERAMRVVLSMDPERIQARQERHGYYWDDLLDSSLDKPVPGELRSCGDCVETGRHLASSV